MGPMLFGELQYNTTALLMSDMVEYEPVRYGDAPIVLLMDSHCSSRPEILFSWQWQKLIIVASQSVRNLPPQPLRLFQSGQQSIRHPSSNTQPRRHGRIAKAVWPDETSFLLSTLFQ